MRRYFLILALACAATVRGFAANGELLSYDAKVRKGSFASDDLFHSLLTAPHGVGQADAHAFPNAIERKLTRIESFVPYDAKRTGIELWTIEHAPGDTVSYLVTLAPDWQGSVAFEVELDAGAPQGILTGVGQDSALEFAGEEFFFRAALEEQRQFTPRGQSDMARSSEMIVLGRFPYARNSAALSGVANMVVTNYQREHAIVLSVRTIAGTDDQPGEEFASVVVPSPVYYEADFCRFRMVNGVGCMVSYQRRIYGANAASDMTAWLKGNGAAAEHNLLNWNGMIIPHAAAQ